MNKRTLPLIVVVLMASSLACSLFSRLSQSQGTYPVSPGEAQPYPVAPLPTLDAQPEEEQPTQEMPEQPSPPSGSASEPVRQWAGEAVASSEYGSSDWSASKATGVTDTYECSDMVTAWAASASDTVEWINVYYFAPMYPSEINIIETYNPDQVIQVDLIDMQGQYVTVYTASPKQIDDPCPYFLNIPVSQSDVLAQGVRITIDQSVLGIGWNEIDAVEMVGTIGQGTPIRPEITAP